METSPAIPTDYTAGLSPEDEEQLRRSGLLKSAPASAIRMPSAIPLQKSPNDPEAPQLATSAPAIPTMGAAAIPLASSNRGIPVAPQTPDHKIPINRATGKPEEINDAGKPIAPGVAGLWARADNVHNPILRTLGKIGAVGARAIDVAGSVAAPGIAAQIPGSTLNQKIGENRADTLRASDTTDAEKKAQTGEAEAVTAHDQAETEALKNPQPKEGLTPEETTIHDLMTGQNGQPRINPETKNPYSYLEAYQAVNQAKADTKPAPTKDDFEQFYSDYIKDNNLPDSAHNRLKARKEFAKAGQAPQQPQQPQRVLGVTPDNKVIEITPGMTIPEGTQTVGGDIKENAGEQAGKAALNYAKDYLAKGQFTGAGDEALMEKFFELAKPSSGFRMTQAQTEMLTKAQDIMNSVVAKGKHLFSPNSPYFSDDLRKQIVDTMGMLESSRTPHATAQDFGPSDQPDGTTGALDNGTKVISKGGRIVAR